MRQWMAQPRSSTSSWLTERGSPSGQTNLLLDDVDARDHAADCVLDLDACFHLREVEVACFIDQKFHPARALVVNLPGDGYRRRPEARALLVIQTGRGRLFDHLLIVQQHGSFTFAQVNDVALVVAQNLHHHVVRGRHGPLQIEAIVTVDPLGLACRRIGPFQSGSRANPPRGSPCPVHRDRT